MSTDHLPLGLYSYPSHRDLGFDVISEAYQHDAPAKADLTMRRGGWPSDHTPEDAFEVTTQPLEYKHNAPDNQYVAEYVSSGGVTLFLVTKKTIASFDTLADAKTAAEALNNHKGY
jgi:hypothetical protein